MNKTALIAFTIQFVIVLGNLITYAIIGRVIVSWISAGKPGSRGRFSQVLFDVTEPFIAVARKILSVGPEVIVGEDEKHQLRNIISHLKTGLKQPDEGK